MALETRTVEAAELAEWDEFVDSHPQGSVFHLSAWRRTIEDVFGYPPHYFRAARNGRWTGVLPLFLIDNFVTGKILVSTPFAVYGGIVACDEESKTALREAARKLGESIGAQYVELRNRWPEQCGGGLPKIDRYATYTFPTVAGEEELLAALPKKARNMVRKTLKLAYSSRILDSGLGIFWDLYTKNLRRLGTPAFPKRHFLKLREHFGTRLDVREILLDGKVVASSVNLIYKGEMHTFYAASDQNYLAYSPNNFMYFDHIRWAAANGCPVFDYGRSKHGTGPAEFKKNVGATMAELPYEVILIRRKELPNFTPQNPKFELAIQIWRRLPLWFTRWIGPRLVKLFP